MSKEVQVAKLPHCDFCDKDAEYDFRTKMGPWANGCEPHYREHRLARDLGTGRGQRLVVKS